jgi:cytochrome c oxidase subunit II
MVLAMSAKRRGAPIAVLLLAATSAGCGGEQSALNPRSEASRNIATLWWWMLGAAAVVFAGAVGMLVLAWLARRRDGAPLFGRREGFNLGMVVLFGMGIPSVVLIGLFVVANFAVLPSTEAPAASRTAMTIEVTGQQWFWQVRYPGTGAVTANEIHIPVGTRVNVVAQTADVIHSFWIPELNRKIDMIPGRRNRVLLYADKPGRYRGQCAEFCGLQHAHMSMYVFAETPARFRAWLAAQSKPEASPVTASARRGEQVFMDNQCASCHTIRGTPAAGQVGPDLTHVGARSTLAALTIPNDPAHLEAWIRNPQLIKPGNRMPSFLLDKADTRAVVDYLKGLR